MDAKYAALSIWIFGSLFLGAWGWASLAPEMAQFYSLSKTNQTTSAEIIETYPRKHSCKYRFFAGNRFYENFGRECGKEPTGKKIIVYFSPSGPDKSVNENPRSLFFDDLILLGAIIVCFPTLAAYTVYKTFASTTSTS